MSKIKVDLEELISRLKEIKQEGYVIVEVEIEEDEYDKELRVNAIGMELEQPLNFIRMGEVNEDFDV